MIEKIIYLTGQRANLIAITCNEMLKTLDVTTRIFDETEVVNALNSKEIQGALLGWENLTRNELDNHLDRLIIYMTVQEGEFTLSSLLKLLESYDHYSLEQIKRSLDRLSLSFIIKQEYKHYIAGAT